MPLHRKANVRPTAAAVVALFTFAVAVAACGATAASQSAGVGSTSAASSPGADASTTAATDLAAIGCATDDPEDVGALTGAWRGDDGGVYYIRQVGECVWWFGTDLAAVEQGKTGQNGFANVAAGRVDGTDIELEWADVPLGGILGGGGLTVRINEGGDFLQITKQRGDWGFGAKSFVRMANDANPSESATP